MYKSKSLSSSMVIALALGLLPLLPICGVANDQATSNRVLSLYFSRASAGRKDLKPSNKPISATALRKAVKVAAGSSTARLRKDLMNLIVKQINRKGISFQPTAEETDFLRDAGASDQVLTALEAKGRERAMQLEAEAWQACAKSSQTELIHAFLDQYPESRFAESARTRLAELSAQSKEPTEETAPVNTEAESHNLTQPASQLELLAWQKAQTEGSSEAFSNFIQAYPQSLYATSAQQRLAQLAWDDLKNSADQAAFSDFLTTYPEGALADAARIRLEQLRWEATLQGSKTKDFEEYLRNYPDGHFASVARERLDRLENPSKYEMKSDGLRPLEIKEEELRRHIVKEVLPQPLSNSHHGKSVKVRIVLSLGGTIQLLEAVDGSRSLSKDAIELVRQWQFRPVESQGKPVHVESVLTIRFSASPQK